MTPVMPLRKQQDEFVENGFESVRFQVYTERHLERIEPLKRLTEEQRFEMRVVANVLPFRVNQYVIDELIDWNNIPQDPIFQLTFPQRGMLAEEDFNRMADAQLLAVANHAPPEVIADHHDDGQLFAQGRFKLHKIKSHRAVSDN